MTKRPPLRLSTRLTIQYALIFSAVLLLLNAGTLLGVRYYLTRQAENQLQDATRALLAQTAEASDAASLAGVHLALPQGEVSISARIADAQGQVLQSAGRVNEDIPAADQSPGVTVKTEADDGHFLSRVSMITAKGQTIGSLQVIADMGLAYHFLKLLTIFTAIADGLGLAVSVIAGHFMSRRALKPIGALTEAAAGIGADNLTERVPVPAAQDELSELAQTFNGMLDRLEASFDAQARFVSDASHELRTPIAVIKGYADLMANWAQDDPAARDESVAAIQKEADGMSQLVQSLLTLARGDSGRLRLEKTAFPCRPLLDELAAEVRLLAPSHPLTADAPADLMLTADRTLIKECLRALMDNALKYTPAEGAIALAAWSQDGDVLLQVTDAGPGIPPAEREHVFDRFTRLDSSRARAAGGTGLGLAIVKTIVQAHGGTIAAVDPPAEGPGGACIRIALPQAPRE